MLVNDQDNKIGNILYKIFLKKCLISQSVDNQNWFGIVV